LPENYILAVAGGAVAAKTVGDENNYPNCLKAVKELRLEKRVFFFINLPQDKMEIIFNTCDIFVQPNIKIPGSMEGFGITAIEAAACKRVVLASNIEGLKDAVKNNENGIALESGNAEQWIDKIKEVMENDRFREEFGEKAKKFIEDNFTWEKISKKYLEEMERVAKSRQ